MSKTTFCSYGDNGLRSFRFQYGWMLQYKFSTISCTDNEFTLYKSDLTSASRRCVSLWYWISNRSCDFKFGDFFWTSCFNSWTEVTGPLCSLHFLRTMSTNSLDYFFFFKLSNNLSFCFFLCCSVHTSSISSSSFITEFIARSIRAWSSVIYVCTVVHSGPACQYATNLKVWM